MTEERELMWSGELRQSLVVLPMLVTVHESKSDPLFFLEAKILLSFFTKILPVNLSAVLDYVPRFERVLSRCTLFFIE
jgi:hypothetical protein